MNYIQKKAKRRKKHKELSEQYKQINAEKIADFVNKIALHKDKLWCPTLYNKFAWQYTNSCYDMSICRSNKSFDEVTFISNKINDKVDDKLNDKVDENTKCLKINMVVTNEQHKILQRWFNSYIMMYNETVNYIKSKLSFNDIKLLKNSYTIEKNLNSLKKTNTKHLTNLQKQKTKLLSSLNSIIKKKNKGWNKKLDIIRNDIHVTNQNITNTNKELHNLNIEIEQNKKYHKKVYNIVNFYKLRTELKNNRETIIETSQHDQLNYNTKINVHNIDYAIKSACTSYKSCITNYINGHQKSFRVKFMRLNKKRKVMDIESSFIKQNQICYKILGEIKYTYNNMPYILTSTKNVKIFYDSELEMYNLLVPEIVNTPQTTAKRYIGIDQGIRTFATGLSNDHAIKIGTNMSGTIKKYFKRIDTINAKEENEKIRKRKVKKYTRKMKAQIDELHWKSINFLTENYKDIIIGKFSIKDCIKKEDSVLDKMTKRIGQLLSPYKYRQRLQYKCATRGNNYIEQDEGYTTKICSKCGNYSKTIGGKKVYDCNKCHVEIDRDVNSGRGILIKSMKSE